MNVLTDQLSSLLGGEVLGNISGNDTDFIDEFLISASRTSPLVQGFLFIYGLLKKYLGFDPSLIVTILGYAWGVSKIITPVYTMVMALVDKHRSSISIDEDDDIYDHVMEWLSIQPAINSDRHLMAQTKRLTAWEEDDQDMDDGEGSARASSSIYMENGEGTDKYLNFSNQAVRVDPRYVPGLGNTTFQHKGKNFQIVRKKESFMSTGGPSALKDHEQINISCYGHSADPIKKLLKDAKVEYHRKVEKRTTIYRPQAKEFRRNWNMWQQIARRPIRPMETVILDPEEKLSVLVDINDYLHPGTPRWYASRGIPLRRGYLFHGPPGTGKTSFAFAIAGFFGLAIYVISLQDVNVTEEDLAALFAILPRRCVVLLEDIDTAGLKRPEDTDEAQEQSGAAATVSSETISLSGLLNAIDGVASPEGRILILTTNKPESLDGALVRPGRVDTQVCFNNASPLQAAELFYRMYEAPDAEAEDKLELSELRTAAHRFGEMLPDNTFSPAEIQGFLLKAEEGSAEGGRGCTSLGQGDLKQKEAKKKVSTVQ